MLLPNNCSCSELSVHPSNWKTSGKNVDNWYIQYYFRDPQYKDRFPNGKLCILKVPKSCVTVQQKRDSIASKLSVLTDLLQQGYNPHKKGIISPTVQNEVSEKTLFIAALNYAFSQIEVSPGMRTDMRSHLKYITEAANVVNINLPISEVRRRHIKSIFKHLETNRPIWNNGRFNKYRTTLKILFNELMELEVVESSPIDGIKSKTQEQKIQETLTREQRKQVDQYLRRRGQMAFRLYMRIFFHSGIRSSELLLVKAKDVDLADQTVKVIIRKGKTSKEVDKSVKNIAVRYWKLALKNAEPEEYIFSKHLKPGKKSINYKQISRRWKVVMKDNNLTCTFYRFKHANTTEVIDLMGHDVAAELNSHTGTAMVRKIYDTKRVSREHEAIKKVNNNF